MKRSLFVIVILLIFLGCRSEVAEKKNVASSPPSFLPPVVLSVKLSYQKDIDGETSEYVFTVKFSRDMDHDSVENALHIFKLVGNVSGGVNVIRNSEEVVTPNFSSRYEWPDNRTLLVRADLRKDSIYFLFISSLATDKEGNPLDGRVGEDFNNDGIQEIFPFRKGEFVTTNNDFLYSPSDFWSQPIIPDNIRDVKDYYYALPSDSYLTLQSVRELELKGDVPGSEHYEFMGNIIDPADGAFSFSWPVKVDSLLEFDFTSRRNYSYPADLHLRIPPVLIDPETLKNFQIYTEGARFLSDAVFVYNDDYGKTVPVPLTGKIVSFANIDPQEVNPDIDYWVEVNFGKSIPSHTLGGTYLVIDGENEKYILPVTDNINNRVKIRPLYIQVRGRRNQYYRSLFEVDDATFLSGELEGMLVYSESFGHRDNEVFRIQSNTARKFVVARVSGSGNNVMDCTDLQNEYCKIFIFFDGNHMHLSGEKAYITNNVFYLKIPSLEEGVRYFIRLNPGTYYDEIRDIWGFPLSDEVYDGAYRDGTGKAENTITFSFVTRSKPIMSYPPTMLINDGSIYPYAVTGMNCSEGVCLDPESEVSFAANCGGKKVVRKGYSSLFFSFYTPDGDNHNLYGYNDFLNPQSVNEETVNVIGGKRPVSYRVKIERVVGRFDESTPGKGGYPTDLVKVTLLPRIVRCGDKYVEIPVVFQKGDLLVISHRIEALTSNPNRKFDGNRDGVIEYSSVDDLRMVFDGEKFVKEK